MKHAIRLCADCMLIALNDDDQGRVSTRNHYYAGILDWEDELDARVRVIVDTDAGASFLNVTRCGICGSRWAGDYYRATVVAA